MKATWLCLIIVLPALFAAGCCRGKKSDLSGPQKGLMEKLSEGMVGGKPKADSGEEKIDVISDKEQLAVPQDVEAEIPEGFPKDIPVYLGAGVVAAGHQGDRYTLLLETKDDFEAIVDIYKQTMVHGDWKEQMIATGGTDAFLVYTKEKRKATISITRNSEKNTISIITQ